MFHDPPTHEDLQAERDFYEAENARELAAEKSIDFPTALAEVRKSAAETAARRRARHGH
ncbi:hypothetical protein AB0I28_32560 [Phytomonospora sp. NPDC050363]|uniref:hypothetical protein n=1 Tax=Phytomonospora sp. NPDC050363 TaxID=3155642 RepID=UPI0033D7D7C6